MSVTGVDTTSPTYASDAMKKTIGMNKDDFLKMFIAQLQNQDPLAPQDPTAMLGQLAQLTQVEQSYNTAAALQKLLMSQDNSLAMTSVALIGKEVTAFGTQASFDGENSVSLNYQLPTAATASTLNITNASGQTVRTVDLGELAAGNGKFMWDGKDGQGNRLPAGAYDFSLSGTAANGVTMTATTYTTGRADGITFDNGAAYVTMGAVSIPFTSVMSVKAL